MPRRRPRNWKLRLEDILGCIARIEHYTSGFTFESFQADQKTIDAVVRNVEVIGEAARHVPDDVVQRYPDVPWAKMRAMRNRLIHDYAEVSVPILWQTIQGDLPPLVPLLRAILKRQP